MLAAVVYLAVLAAFEWLTRRDDARVYLGRAARVQMPSRSNSGLSVALDGMSRGRRRRSG